MTAILTDNLKRELLDRLLTSTDSDKYYIGIGRSEPWNDSDIATAPVNCLSDVRGFRNSMQAVKVVQDVTFCVPRTNWASGTTYTAYDDTVSGHTTPSFFVFTDENNVYACIERGRSALGATKASTIKPTGQATTAFQTADGYTWKFMYTITTAVSTKFLSSNFVPVEWVDSDEAATNVGSALQRAVQTAATAGEILSIPVTAGGSGYTSAPTVTIKGSGTGATATATIASGAVVKIEMVTRGSGYGFADVAITGGAGSGATARAVIGNTGGFGFNPIDDLKSKALMFNIKPDGFENEDFIVGQDFRQIGIIQNPTDYAGTKYTGSTGSTLKKIVLSTTAEAGTFTLDQTFTGNATSNRGLVDYIDSDTIFYHQNTTTGFGSFDSDTTITAPGASGTISQHIDSADVDFMSGKVLVVDNRSAITRDANQTEDIKVIIQI